MNGEIACSTCAAACCGPNIGFKLNEAEKQYMTDAGAVMEADVEPQQYFQFVTQSPDNLEIPGMVLGIGEGHYVLTSSCGYVTGDNRCAVHEDPKRPRDCKNLIAGSAKCLEIRKARGIDQATI